MARTKLTEQEKITKWADKVAKAYNSVNVLKDYNDEISLCTCHNEAVHVFSGLEKIAELMGLDVHYRDRGDEEYPIEVSFIYKNVKFFQLNRAEDNVEEDE